MDLATRYTCNSSKINIFLCPVTIGTLSVVLESLPGKLLGIPIIYEEMFFFKHILDNLFLCKETFARDPDLCYRYLISSRLLVHKDHSKKQKVRSVY